MRPRGHVGPATTTAGAPFERVCPRLLRGAVDVNRLEARAHRLEDGGIVPTVSGVYARLVEVPERARTLLELERGLVGAREHLVEDVVVALA